MELAEAETRSKRSLQGDDIEILYQKAFPFVARFVAKMNGSPEDATDIFHDALIIYYEKDTLEKLNLHSDPVAYLLGIAKHLWIRKFNNDKRLVRLTEAEHRINLPPDYFPSVNASRLLAFLERTGKRCLDLLHAYYFEEKKVDELSRSFHYRHEHSASVQKYKCIEKLRDLMKQKSASYEDFLD